MEILKRFLNYITIDTESDEANAGKIQPSSQCQWELARVLEKELLELGADVSVSEYGIIYGTFWATAGLENKTAFGMIAHMDTVKNGTGIKPSVIENYNGEDLLLRDGSVLSLSENPELAKLKGRSLIVSDGTTILGADDKAGIAAIMHMCQRLVTENVPHGKVCVAFTPDEEIGCGVDHFDIETFGAKYAVTVDGGAENSIEYENFNAAQAHIEAVGVQSHPGSAKGIMVNAAAALCEFQNRLPKQQVPERTENKEGFYHLMGMEAYVEKGHLDYLIREFDAKEFGAKKERMHEIANQINQEMGREVLSVDITDSYYNMAEIIEKNRQLLTNIEDAMKRSGLTAEYLPIRGGTDGCRLSFMGLPCPNIGAGGYLFHSKHEHCSLEGMELAASVLLELVKIYAE